MVRASHVAYELFYGTIPDWLQVLHHCDNPACISPRHLFLGTHTDNMHDRTAKRRHAFGIKHGMAKLTEKDVIAIRERYATGTVSQYQLAAEYGVYQASIGRIVNRKGWKHVK